MAVVFKPTEDSLARSRDHYLAVQPNGALHLSARKSHGGWFLKKVWHAYKKPQERIGRLGPALETWVANQAQVGGYKVFECIRLYSNFRYYHFIAARYNLSWTITILSKIFFRSLALPEIETRKMDWLRERIVQESGTLRTKLLSDEFRRSSVYKQLNVLEEIITFIESAAEIDLDPAQEDPTKGTRDRLYEDVLVNLRSILTRDVDTHYLQKVFPRLQEVFKRVSRNATPQIKTELFALYDPMAASYAQAVNQVAALKQSADTLQASLAMRHLDNLQDLPPPCQEVALSPLAINLQGRDEHESLLRRMRNNNEKREWMAEAHLVVSGSHPDLEGALDVLALKAEIGSCPQIKALYSSLAIRFNQKKVVNPSQVQPQVPAVNQEELLKALEVAWNNFDPNKPTLKAIDAVSVQYLKVKALKEQVSDPLKAFVESISPTFVPLNRQWIELKNSYLKPLHEEIVSRSPHSLRFFENASASLEVVQKHPWVDDVTKQHFQKSLEDIFTKEALDMRQVLTKCALYWKRVSDLKLDEKEILQVGELLKVQTLPKAMALQLTFILKAHAMNFNPNTKWLLLDGNSDTDVIPDKEIVQFIRDWHSLKAALRSTDAMAKLNKRIRRRNLSPASLTQTGNLPNLSSSFEEVVSYVKKMIRSRVKLPGNEVIERTVGDCYDILERLAYLPPKEPFVGVFYYVGLSLMLSNLRLLKNKGDSRELSQEIGYLDQFRLEPSFFRDREVDMQEIAKHLLLSLAHALRCLQVESVVHIDMDPRIEFLGFGIAQILADTQALELPDHRSKKGLALKKIDEFRKLPIHGDRI